MLNFDLVSDEKTLMAASDAGIPIVARVTSEMLGHIPVCLSAHCSLSELNGTIDSDGGHRPAWIDELYEIEDKQDVKCILLIEDFNTLKLEDQCKFTEIVKYKKSTVYDLPQNCHIILSWNSQDRITLAENIAAYVAWLP